MLLGDKTIEQIENCFCFKKNAFKNNCTMIYMFCNHIYTQLMYTLHSTSPLYIFIFKSIIVHCTMYPYPWIDVFLLPHLYVDRIFMIVCEFFCVSCSIIKWINGATVLFVWILFNVLFFYFFIFRIIFSTNTHV